ncbi:MAG: aspartate--tRNA(Asn) ligase [Candidatus Pacearchaeota archaeon]
MERFYVSQLKIGKEVLLRGWVYDIRELSKMMFVLLRDITGVVQCVIKDEDLIKELSNLRLESVVEIKGKVKKAEVKAEFARQDIEVEVLSLKLLNKAEELPIQVNEKAAKSELSTKLDWRSLSLRNLKSQAIFKIQAKIIEGMREYLESNGFIHVFTPSLIGVASESGSEVFEVKYFETKAYLRQDPQLHRQLSVLGGIEKIYEIGPSWRAEKSNTIKHLTEHRVCAVEMAFIDSEEDIMRMEEQVIISALKKVIEKCKDELKILGVKITIPKSPFLEIRFPDIYEILSEMGKNISFGDSLDSEAEKLIWQYIQKRYPSTEFYFINKFPFVEKPFYVYCEENEKYARSTDLYYKGVELSSGGQREHRYFKLLKNINERNIPKKSVEWFIKFFKFGAPPHGGFAIGIERLTMTLLNLDNIREAVLFPRDPNRLVP